MSDVLKDFGRVWDRLFDHKGFLTGEIYFMLCEFEQKRQDKEVDALFNVIENITEIKDTGIDHLRQVHDQTEKINYDLNQALNVCGKFSELEKDIIQDNAIEETRLKRKIIWESFMNGITTKYCEINSSFEVKEEELKKLFKDIEKKLLI